VSASSPQALRAAAQARFDALGVPDRALEAWKYTSTRAISGTSWTPAVAGAASAGPSVGGVDGLDYDMAFANTALQGSAGRGRASLNADSVGGLVDLSLEHAGLWALNAAQHEAVAQFDVEAGAVLPGALAVRWHIDASGEPTSAHPRTVLRVGANARVVLVEHLTSDGHAWQNAVTELELGPGASVHYVRLQSQSAASVSTSALFARIGRDASLVTHDLVCGASLSRAEVHVQLAEPGASCALNGLYVLDGTRHADLYTRVHHWAPHTSSEELYKGALRDASRGAFTGSIVMTPGVRGASTRQENPNLLLGDEAHVDTRPQLEIFHNDVKAYHGATIGRLDPAAVFYLRSRGLSPDAARRLLTAAFCNTVIDTLPLDALRTHTQAWLEATLSERAAS
jgi:Fe-S cluster assembly protein SufD